MRVALIGPPYSGKTTLFQAVAAAGGTQIDVSRSDQPHLAVVKVPDDRLKWLAELYKPKKTTPAELEFIDLPGLNLVDEASRTKSRQLWSAMRQADMLVMVVRGFKSDAVSAYRKRIDATADAEELQAEMLFADLDQVTNRVERLEAQLKKPGNRDATQHELDLMRRLQQALESGQPIRSALQSAEEEKTIRSFAFLSVKPHLVVVNCDEDEAAAAGDAQVAGLEALRLSARIEEEIAQLPEADRAAFMVDLGLAASARDRLIQACYRKLNLISMFTAGDDECKAWTLPAGTDAVTAAGEIHSDIARGFIRAETMSYTDLHAAKGEAKAVKAAGRLRLEGKQYVVLDGDIINFRFAI